MVVFGLIGVQAGF